MPSIFDFEDRAVLIDQSGAHVIAGNIDPNEFVLRSRHGNEPGLATGRIVEGSGTVKQGIRGVELPVS